MKGSLVSRGDVTQGTGEVSSAIYFESPHRGENHVNIKQYGTSATRAEARARVCSIALRRARSVRRGEEHKYANRTEFCAVHGRSSYGNNAIRCKLWHRAH